MLGSKAAALVLLLNVWEAYGNQTTHMSTNQAKMVPRGQNCI